jgi:hypothetical protein
MNPELLLEAEQLWRKKDAIDKFGSQFRITPPDTARTVIDGFSRVENQLRTFEQPLTVDQLNETELKRRLSSEWLYQDRYLRGALYSWPDVLNMLGISQEEIDAIPIWIDNNMRHIRQAVEDKFQRTVVMHHRDPIDLNDYEKASEAEGVARTEIRKVHRHIGSLLQQQTEAGAFLRDITTSPLRSDRSYFNPRTRSLHLSVPAICYLEPDGAVRIDYHELIRLFGHEGMGHALQQVITMARTDLPFFLRESANGTIAEEESVTQYYEQQLFADLMDDTQTQEALGIHHLYPSIYQDELDTRLITEYNRAYFAYIISVIADTRLGDPRDPAVINQKNEIVRQRGITPQGAVRFVDYHARNSIDTAGNLDFGLANELRYSSQAVPDALQTLQNAGITYATDRSKVDLTLLTGYWTPQGLRQKAELVAKGLL